MHICLKQFDLLEYLIYLRRIKKKHWNKSVSNWQKVGKTDIVLFPLLNWTKPLENKIKL